MIGVANASQLVKRCEPALARLHANLCELGYEFANPSGPISHASGTDVLLLGELEEKYGAFPLLFRSWYQTFRYVDFRQSERQLTQPGSPVSGLGLNCPLVFVALVDMEMLRTDLKQCGYNVGRGSESFLPTGAMASNCEPKGVWVPSSDIDPVLYDEGAGPISFATEVEMALRAGGFPFWYNIYRKARHISPLGHSPAFPIIFPKLVQGL